MNQTLHWACAHQWIEPFFAQVLAQRVCKGDFDFFLSQLRFQLQQELVDHSQDHGFVERLEADGSVQPIAELWRKEALDVGHLVARLARVGKANRGFVHRLGTGIGGHDDDDIAEICLTPVVIGQCAVVHDLQQHIEDVRVGFFNLVEQQHAMRLFGHRFSQQAALVKAHIARWRANQAADGMALHVLAHVKANQLNAHDVGQLLGGFGFTNAGGAAEQERTDRLVVFAQTGARHFYSAGEHVERFVLAEHHAF